MGIYISTLEDVEVEVIREEIDRNRSTTSPSGDRRVFKTIDLQWETTIRQVDDVDPDRIQSTIMRFTVDIHYIGAAGLVVIYEGETQNSLSSHTISLNHISKPEYIEYLAVLMCVIHSGHTPTSVYFEQHERIISDGIDRDLVR